jgi:hypothetical protein
MERLKTSLVVSVFGPVFVQTNLWQFKNNIFLNYETVNLFTFVLPSKWTQEHSIWLRIGEVIKIFNKNILVLHYFWFTNLVVFWNVFRFLSMPLTVFVQNLCFWAYFKRFLLHLQDYSFWTGQDRFLCSLSFSKIKNWSWFQSKDRTLKLVF